VTAHSFATCIVGLLLQTLQYVVQQYSSLNKVLIKVYNKIYRKDLKKKLHPSKTAIAAAAYQLREGEFFEG